MTTDATEKNKKTVVEDAPTLDINEKYCFFMKIESEKFAFLLMILLTLQPLVGIFFKANTSQSLLAIFLTKATFIRWIGILALVNALIAYCQQSIKYGKKMVFCHFFLKNPWVGLFTLLLFWSFLTCITSRNFYTAIFADGYRYEGFCSFVAYAGIFASASLLKEEKKRHAVLVSFVMVSTVLSCLSLLKGATGTTFILDRGSLVGTWSATFVNSNHYAYYLCMAMAVLAGLLLSTDSLIQIAVYTLSFSLHVLTLLYNQTLGCYLAIWLGMILLTILAVIRNGLKKSSCIFLWFFILLFFSITINNRQMFSDIIKTAEEASSIATKIEEGIASHDMDTALNGVDGGSGRFSIWRATWQCIMNHPILGHGPESIQYDLKEILGRSEMPHNEYLEITADMGFPALALYLTALIWFFVRCMKHLKKITPMILCAGVCAATYLISAFVGVSMTIATCYLYLMLGVTNSYFANKTI